MEATEALTTTDVNHAIGTTTITAREPQSPYEQNGEAGETTSPSFDATATTDRETAVQQKPRPVTAATARRRRLWEEGTLVLEDPFGAYRVTEITEGWMARTRPNDPGLEPQAFELFPERTLMFTPSQNGAEGQCTEGQCDHEWQKNGRTVEPDRGHGHPHGPAPADYEQLPDRCTKCGTKRTEVSSSAQDSSVDDSSSEGHVEFDEIDTKHALRHVRSALEDAECIAGRPILKMSIERDLRHAKQILEDHAERNDFAQV